MTNATTKLDTTRLENYIKEMMPGAHGHQIKTLTAFVAAILDKQTGCQAELARTQGNQEAGVKRLGRLLHNERLSPKELAEAICKHALASLPASGIVRFTLDWTSEGNQHLLVVSLVVGRRALPIFWRAYDQSVLKGRTKRYELAVVKRAFTMIFKVVAPRRVRLTADRGFADTGLFALLDALRIRFVIRVKGSTKIERRGRWVKLNTVGFAGNTRRFGLGRIGYCESAPCRVWINLSRARTKKGTWGVWYLASNFPLRAGRAAEEYGRRFTCEEGFRDVKWYLGFAESRIADIRAWSRLFALFVLALSALTTLGMALLLADKARARHLLRRVVSRRRDRCELSLVAAVIALLDTDFSLINALSHRTKLKLDFSLQNVS